MKVTRIEIFGFKSFMERLVLPLDDGVTGVIGPNGCGKSNIVDAVRWVLGETRAKNLRGGVLEDVIFNGTDLLRPLGLAEVTLTFRASGDHFFADLVSPDLEAELLVEEELSRPQEPEAKSSQAEENEASAQTESEELEISEGADTERPQLTVIQGKLSDSEQTAVEGGVIEDSATESSATSSEEPEEQQQTPAALQQAMSATLLNRFSWLKSANEVQVTRRLYRSGESEFFINRVPCRLKDLRELFRAVGISARAYTLVAQGEIARIVSAKPEERRLILEEAAGVLGFRDKIRAANRRLEDTEINVSRLDDIIKEVTRQVNSLRRQASRAKNRQQLRDEITELEEKLFKNQMRGLGSNNAELTRQLEENKSQEGRQDASLNETLAREEEARNELLGLDVEGDDLRSRIDAIREELSNRAQQRAERTARLNELKAFILSKNSEIERLHQRETTLKERIAQSKHQLVEFEQREKEVHSKLEPLDVQGQTDLEEVTHNLNDLRSELKAALDQHAELRSHSSHVRGILEATERQLRAVSSSPLKRYEDELKDSLDSETRAAVMDGKLLHEMLDVPAHLSAAVQAVLLERLSFVMVEDPHAVGAAVLKVFDDASGSRENGVEQESFGFVGSQQIATEVVSKPLPFAALLSHIHIAPQAHSTIQRLFEHVYLTDNVQQAILYFRDNPTDWNSTLVTPSGEVLTALTFSRFQSESGALGLRERIEELTGQLHTLVGEEEAKRRECEDVRGRISLVERKSHELLEVSQARQEQATTLHHQLGDVRGRLEAERRTSQQMEEDSSRLIQQRREFLMQIDEYQREQDTAAQDVRKLVPEEEDEIRRGLEERSREYELLEERRKTGREKLSTLAEEVYETRRELDATRAQVSQSELAVQRAELELEHQREKIIEEYGEETFQRWSAEAVSFEELSQDEQKEHHERVLQLKKRISREGEVDSSSIERFEEERERLENLIAQKTDLESASATLRRTIERLRATSKQRFVSTFEAVSENFGKLIPRLFGGGKGSLELIDPRNPLDTGVLIIARPPGKKLKSIDLLSGGEKALCATALIFSMFMVRPSPLCVLDEVDAPLDDVNLTRFLSLVKEMSVSTQFLMITHNKGSMAVCDKLVGVTMEQPGATKVLTVSLEEAYSQVA